MWAVQSLGRQSTAVEGWTRGRVSRAGTFRLRFGSGRVSRKVFLFGTMIHTMDVHPNLGSVRADIGPLSRALRPVAVFLGLAAFLVGAVVLGAALAADHSARLTLYTGPMLMLLGVSLVGGALVMEPSEYWLDPEVEITGLPRYFVVGVSGLFVLVVAVVALVGG